jgi:glycosyltransferase involved in cell wall biosynthesis
VKVALVYDWLNIKIGGGENTFAEISKIYPDADIYCLLYNKTKFDHFFKGRNITSSRLRHLPGFMKKNPYLMLPFIKSAVSKFDFEEYDLVISVSSAWVKNIKVARPTIHICYCYSPARMIWDSWPKYLDTQKIGPFRIGPISKFLITRMVSKIRLWDFYSSDSVDSFIAISNHIQNRIIKFYKRKSALVYPPVVMGKGSLVPNNKREYFLVLSSLSKYKNIDVAIRACIKNNKKLVIVGDGPDKSRLTDIAKDSKNIVFVGRVDDDKKWHYHKNAMALIFTSIEDFGIAPVEAMSVGTPVIALKGGGLSETVKSGVNGVFYDDVSSLDTVLSNFETSNFRPEKVRSSVTQYSIENFKNNFSNTVNSLKDTGRYEKNK